MFIHDAARIVKKVLPSPVFKAVRAVGTGVLTPLAFSYHSGHFLSSLKSKAVDKKGTALPWYTYPAIDFLRHKQMTDKTVLEFGSGQSTLWWSQRVRNVVSLEDNESWYQSLRQLVPSNVQLVLGDTFVPTIER